MECHLVIRTQDGRERSFELRLPRTIIGRETRCDVRVPLPTVEQEHCEIVVVEDGGLELQDLGSETGTWHNGNRVERARLAHADELRVGAVTFRVHLNGTG